MSDPKLANLVFTLQDSINPEDHEWSFTIPNLPKASTLNSSGLIKSVSVVSNPAKQNIILRFVGLPHSRATAKDASDRFVSVSFADFRLRYPNKDHTINEEAASPSTPATAIESADYVTRMLESGLVINGVAYRFYGHSSSQLKSRTCVLFAASKEEISRKVESLGDFSKMKSVAKKAKRIGLLFSVAETTSELQPDLCEDIPDVTSKDYNFTDGCGLISSGFATTLVKSMNIRFRNQRYVPSVFQIRYRGYKGVLMTDLTMKSKTKVKFRESMKKFKGGEDLSFSVIEYAKPYVFGSLNDEVILLLHSLGISMLALCQKQQEYFDFLSASKADPKTAFRLLTYTNHMDLAERVLLDGIESVRDRISSIVNQEFNKLMNTRGIRRCRIMIPQSRLLFGVCDPTGVLREGECAVKVTLEGDGQPRALAGMEILVTRNPCLHPGDLQKFRVVAKLELSHLVDCIVFPIRGRRPSADMMSGGDLDGDKFFVCWDPDLVPAKISQPARYQGPKEPVTLKPITDNDRLQYFARYTNASLGRVKNLFLDWARAKGPMSGECQELNHLFSQSVDGARIKIPKHLENPPPPMDPPFILDTLHQAAEEHVSVRRSLARDGRGVTFDMMQLLLGKEENVMTEFELVKLTCRWCLRNRTSLVDFLEYFDFSQLSDEEKTWTLTQMPPSTELSSLVLNGLLSSTLLSASELAPHRLDHPSIHWKPAFNSARDRMALFLESVTRVLENFHKKIIILRLDERLTIAIYVPKKVEKGRDCLVDDKVRLFAFPHSQMDGTFHGCVVPTKKTYRLYCDDGIFQLYQAQRANTWIFITRPGSNDTTYKDLRNQGDKRRRRQATVDEGLNRDFITSIAIDKFSRSLQTHIGRVNRNPIMAAEIYVISNRDIRSSRILDLWLQQVDTEEVMPLFPDDAKEYNVLGLSSVDWSQESAYLKDIVHKQNFSHFTAFGAHAEFTTVFEWLWERDQRMLLRNIFQFILRNLSTLRADSRCVVSAMIRFVDVAPPLALTFRTLDDWTETESPLHITMVEGTPRLLQALITSAQEVQELVIEPFRHLLHSAPKMSLKDFTALVKTISLTVRSPDIALDLLIGSLEPESERLLAVPSMAREHFVRCLIGLALDHIDEVKDAKVYGEGLLDLKRDKDDRSVSARLRIDAKLSTPLQNSDHVQLTTASSPKNSLVRRIYSMDAIVKTVEQGSITCECCHAIPPYVEECSWKLTNFGPYVTTQTMIDAVYNFATDLEGCCPIQEQLLGSPVNTEAAIRDGTDDHELSREDLNGSQNAALKASISGQLTLLWGPPGTGKSHTIVAVLQELLSSDPNQRILVAAPTHNAVDNVMRKYIEKAGDLGHPIRVSTDIRKVADDIRNHTCDAMVGKELREDFKAQKLASRRIKSARLIFTTCIGAALGLLRKENFSTVIIDEASQQTEPMSLVPLVKGCTKAILVGDHVQLRATVQPLALLQQFEISLFERLYNLDNVSIQKVMLDSQYRMHRDICSFSSQEFYGSRLRTAVPYDARPLHASEFSWPVSRRDERDKSRMVFVNCSSTEDIGQKSKSNKDQAKLCHSICTKLLTAPSTPSSAPQQPPSYTTAVLTPYSRQADLLKTMLPPTIAVSSIDGFQGREADIVIFVTVRSNVHAEIGFLKDLRRLNVVMTRAKTGCIVIGDRATLTQGPEEEESVRVWRRLVGSLDEVRVSD